MKKKFRWLIYGQLGTFMWYKKLNPKRINDPKGRYIADSTVLEVDNMLARLEKARACGADTVLFDIGEAIGVPRSRFTENALSTAMVFSLGGFRYYNGGDFSWRVKTSGGAFTEIEDYLAPECPEVDVANANHHGHHSMTDALVKALRARVVVAGVWHQEHMNRPTMRRLAKATWPCLYAPGLFPAKRRQKDAAEPWLKDVAPESFTGAHAVIDVASDGQTYRLMMVSAADESRRILGAYD